MQPPEIAVAEAKQRLDSGAGWIYLDVRTVPEYVAGHPPGALSVPIAEIDPVLGRMEMNPRFLQVVRANLPQDSLLVVGCRSGSRSEAACQVLLQAGYRNVTNVRGGFGGVVNPSGQVIEEGWSTLGLPVERGNGGDKGYEALSAKTAR